MSITRTTTVGVLSLVAAGAIGGGFALAISGQGNTPKTTELRQVVATTTTTPAVATTTVTPTRATSTTTTGSAKGHNDHQQGRCGAEGAASGPGPRDVVNDASAGQHGADQHAHEQHAHDGSA